jgi:hypothetical protein
MPETGTVLAVHPCRELCDWVATKASYAQEGKLACRGCGSEWVRSEPWTPRQADGTVPESVREALRQGAQRGWRGRGWQRGQE